MSKIDIKFVKDLRERTQAGFSDCQKALSESDNNLDQAILWLKEKGAVKAEKKAGAIAAEGLTHVIKKGNKALLTEINSETDFVAKNDDFKKLAQEIEAAIFDAEVTEKALVDELVLTDGKKIKEACIEATAKIGEKISFRRAELVNFPDKNIVIGIYSHHNKKFAAVVAIEGSNNEVVANEIAMHVGALNPKFLNIESIDSSWIEQQKIEIREKALADLEEKAKKANKSMDPKHIEKTVQGRLQKLFSEFALENQPFAKEPSRTVNNYISENGGGKLIYMQRYELGEGIERKTTDFAAEVAAQMNPK